ncbi:MAG: toll/interleukin-1 receptor domain-containing protein, partial [Treponema sp.]|nr:toll/interleukin-1 receptor domain-containing protein [Treponema sp.]
RRDGGVEFARSLEGALAKQGLRVFLDLDEIEDGEFPIIIEEAIRSAPVFMLILSPHALDRCVNEGDWVRREIETAQKLGKQIVNCTPFGRHIPLRGSRLSHVI